MSHILIVDPDAIQSQALPRLLRAECFRASQAPDGPSALAALRREASDCVLLCDSLRGESLPLCNGIRKATRAPIIVLSRDGSTAHKVLALNAGANDYLTMPFDPRELIARIHAHIRARTEYSVAPRPRPIHLGDLRLDPARHEVLLDGQPIGLTHREYAILLNLAENAGVAVPRERLFEDVWGYDARLGGKLLEVYIRRVRCKIETDPDHPIHLKTVRGFGYRLDSLEGGEGGEDTRNTREAEDAGCIGSEASGETK